MVAELQAAQEEAHQAQQALADRLAAWALESQSQQACVEAEKAERTRLATETGALKQEASQLALRLAACEQAQLAQARDERDRVFSLLENAAALKAQRDRLLIDLQAFRDEASQRETRALQTHAALMKDLVFEQRQAIESISRFGFEQDRLREASGRAVEIELHRELRTLEVELATARSSWFAGAFRHPRTAASSQRRSSETNIRSTHSDSTPPMPSNAKDRGGSKAAESTQVVAHEDRGELDRRITGLVAESAPQAMPLPCQQLSSAATSSGSEHAMKSHQQAAANPRQTLASILCREADDFLEHSYSLLLGRACDVSGKAHFMEALYRGTSKLRVMHDIAHSSEGGGRSVFSKTIAQATRLENLRRLPLLGSLVGIIFRKGLLHYPSVADVVLHLPGRRFVEQAYAHILRRDPDSAGLDSTLRSLYGGIPKIVIIDGMLRSEEYRFRKLENKEFRRLARRQRTSKIPLIGTTLVTLRGLESRTDQGMNIRAIKEIQHLLISKLDQQDERLNTLHKQLAIAAQRSMAESDEEGMATRAPSLGRRSAYREIEDEKLVLAMKKSLSGR